MKTCRCFDEEGVVFPLWPLFADNAVCFPSRTCAHARAINIIVHVFSSSFCVSKNMPRNIAVFQCLTKNFGKQSKIRVKVGVCEKKCINFAPAFEETR